MRAAPVRSPPLPCRSRVLALPPRVALGLALVTFSACRCDEPLIAAHDPVDQIDVFPQKAAARVDVLWVIDNSGSMAAEQDKVASRFNHFFGQLIRSQVDFQIGVVTTDPDEHGVLRAYQGPAVDGCAGCRFITRAVPCPDPDTSVADLGDDEAAIETRLQAGCPAQLVFRTLIRVGIDGSSLEEGFAQSARALGAAELDGAGRPLGVTPPENVGFLRPDASLYVVFVSDEEEGLKSFGAPVDYYHRLFEGLKGPGNERDVVVAAITGYPLADAPVPLDEVCEVLRPGGEGSQADALADEVRATLADYRHGCLAEDGDPADRDTAYAETGGRYVELACRTGGVVANLCLGDYSSALNQLGANAAGLLRRFRLSLPERMESGSDCALFGAEPDLALDCDGDDRTSGPLDGPVCVTGRCLGDPAERLLPRDAVLGWQWDDGAAAVRFTGDCVPAPGSNLTVRYRLRRDNDAICGGT